MTYEEALIKAEDKLSSWLRSSHKSYVGFISAGDGGAEWRLDVNSESCVFIESEGTVALSCFVENSEEEVGRFVVKLENLFEDPFNATKEEVEVFRLEHGFDYPKELISDL